VKEIPRKFRIHHHRTRGVMAHGFMALPLVTPGGPAERSSTREWNMGLPVTAGARQAALDPVRSVSRQRRSLCQNGTGGPLRPGDGGGRAIIIKQIELGGRAASALHPVTGCPMAANPVPAAVLLK
jgi:hypothetical protein